jgi:hypothetical protein
MSLDHSTGSGSIYFPNSGLVSDQTGYATLTQKKTQNNSESFIFAPNQAYERYLKMHKVFVGKSGAEYLETIHQDLKSEFMPRYLCAAGWAGVEAAIVHKQWPTQRRLNLLASGEDCWERAIAKQQYFNTLDSDMYPHLIESSAPYRMAIDVAVLPLLRGLILGYVDKQTCQEVFADCLAIAQANNIQMRLATQAGDIEAQNDHLGFAHECNAMLALNRMYSSGWFAIPAMARSDTGYYHPEQTHDLLVIRRKEGEIQNVLPVEIKAFASLKDRNRYLALLVRGKMHLCIDGQGNHLPDTTLHAITAVHEGTATKKETQIAATISQRFMNMLNDYYAGESLGNATAGGEFTEFHDKTLVAERHPGLGTIAIQAA